MPPPRENEPHTIAELEDGHHPRDTPTMCTPHLVTTTLLVVNILIYVLQGILKQDWTEQMANQPYKTYKFQELYRYITHSFQHLNILHLIFNMLALQLFGQSLEVTFGSLATLGLIPLFSIIIGILYTYTIVILDLVDPTRNWLYHSVAGLSGILFANVWLYFVAFNITTMNCFTFTFPARVYPIVLLFITLLNSIPSFIAHAVGLLTGMMYHYGLLNYITIPRKFLIFFETQTLAGRYLSKIPGYIYTPVRLNQHMAREQFVVFKKEYDTPQGEVGSNPLVKYGCMIFCIRQRRLRTAGSSSTTSSSSAPRTTGPGRVLGAGSTNNTTPSNNNNPRRERGTHPLAQRQQQQQPPPQHVPNDITSGGGGGAQPHDDHVVINMNPQEVGHDQRPDPSPSVMGKVKDGLSNAFSTKKKQGYNKFDNDLDEDDHMESARSTDNLTSYQAYDHRQQQQQLQQQQQHNKNNNNNYLQHFDDSSDGPQHSVFGFDEDDLANMTAGNQTGLDTYPQQQQQTNNYQQQQQHSIISPKKTGLPPPPQ